MKASLTTATCKFLTNSIIIYIKTRKKYFSKLRCVRLVIMFYFIIEVTFVICSTSCLFLDFDLVVIFSLALTQIFTAKGELDHSGYWMSKVKAG